MQFILLLIVSLVVGGETLIAQTLILCFGWKKMERARERIWKIILFVIQQMLYAAYLTRLNADVDIQWPILKLNALQL